MKEAEHGNLLPNNAKFIGTFFEVSCDVRSLEKEQNNLNSLQSCNVFEEILGYLNTQLPLDSNNITQSAASTR